MNEWGCWIEILAIKPQLYQVGFLWKFITNPWYLSAKSQHALVDNAHWTLAQLLSQLFLKIKAWLSSAGWMTIISHSWDSLSITLKIKTHKCVFLRGSFMKLRHFIPDGKGGLKYCVHGRAAICMMAMTGDPSAAILRGEVKRKKKPSRSPPTPSDACWLCLFTADRLMREQYGGGWMDSHCALPLERRTALDGEQTARAGWNQGVGEGSRGCKFESTSLLAFSLQSCVWETELSG